MKYDLIVVGGGTSGIFSALAASRSGLDVAVIDKNFYLGGMIGSGLTEMDAVGFRGDVLYKGIEREFFEKLIEKKAAEYHFRVPMSSNKNIEIDRLRYDPEKAKLLLEEMAVNSKIDIYYGVELLEAVEGESCRVVVGTVDEKIVLKSNYLIDATGNAHLAKMLGAQTTKIDESEQLVSTLLFRISNVNIDLLNRFIRSDKLVDIINKGYERGILKGKILAFTPIPGTKDVSLNVTRAKFDFESSRGLTRGLIETRMQIEPIFNFVKENVSGLKDSYISNISSNIGIRDARQVIGEYTLTINDLVKKKKFKDSIACGCCPVDIHHSKTDSVTWKMLPGIYYIPYRSIIPKGLNRTLVVGKAISADRNAFGAIRVMPIMMNIGESAGYAISLAKRENKNINELDIDKLNELLESI